MRLTWFVLAAALAGPVTAFGQPASDPAVVDYLYVEGRQVHLTQVADAPFYRIHGNGNVASTEAARQPMVGVMSFVDLHLSRDQLALRLRADTAAAARKVIQRLSRIKEAEQLRVFTIGESRTLLIEYPEIILQCDERVTLDEVQQYLRKHYQVSVVPTGLHPGQFLVRVLTPAHTLWLANQLRTTTAIPIRYADVNFFLAQPSGTSGPEFPTQWPSAAGTGLPSDSGFADQWALENRGLRPGAVRGADIGFVRALKHGPLDATGVKIAVLDYAIDVDHPDLSSSIDAVFNAARYNPLAGMNDPALRTLDFDVIPEAQADHGTACAGIIAARTSNGIGVAGAAPGAKIIAIQIARPSAEDLHVVSGLTLSVALQAAQTMGADIVSLSWGVSLPSAQAYSAVRAEIDLLGRARGGKGAVMISAAGNDQFGILDPDFPANYANQASNLISAGASDWCGQIKRRNQCDYEDWQSRFGPQTLLAPGVGILTTTNARDKSSPNALNNYRVNFAGTSAATPFIAAAAALVLKRNPTWTAAQVRDHLLQTADKLTKGGYVSLDICNALYGAAQCQVPSM
jgi:hypothetical protein